MITLSTKVRYATRIMIALAADSKGDSVRKKDLAHSEGISSDYVEQILIKLKTGRLVESRRGAGGGFVLARPAREINLNDIVEAVEGPIILAPCDVKDCLRGSACVTQPIWKKASEMLRDFFRGVRLSDLVRDHRAVRSSQASSFEI